MIDSFKSKYFFLSNFYNSEVEFEGLTYRNNEAAFQAAKIKDPEDRKSIKIGNEIIDFRMLSASNAKKYGRCIKLREDWEIIKDSIMYIIVLDKFSRSKYLSSKLIETNDRILIEGNDWNDKYWGVCNGIGENKLGNILMKVRNEINIFN